MNEDDLRDCLAMFAMNGIIARGGLHPELMSEDDIARRSYDVADAMLEARRIKEDDGIVSIKKRARKPK
jgi:hypothetical protein